MPQLAKLSSQPTLIFGSDPEFFFEREGSIIGSERVLERELIGIEASLGSEATRAVRTGKLVLDGVQVELHPYPSTCRAGMCLGIAAGMRALKEHLSRVDYTGVKASFKTVIEVPEEEFAALSRSSKELGCKPSYHVPGTGESILHSIDSQSYRTRSAGGHIHLGLPPNDTCSPSPWTNYSQVQFKADYDHYPPERLVRLLDIIVGNTCVMLDRDPGQQERRRVYGLAGEYRTPVYGIEYRTLSNFWLRSCPLASLVTGLARLAATVIYSNGTYSFDHDASLLSVIDYERVIQAINNNDEELARSNWQVVKRWISENVMDSWVGYTGENPITLIPSVLEDFEYFLSKPLDHWFKEDPVDHWAAITNAHGRGFESFLINTVRKEMRG